MRRGKQRYSPERTARHFWAKVDTSSSDGHWLWTGGTVPAGYGTFFWKGRAVRAHRVAWMLTHGVEDIPTGLCVCHHCDVPLCVRPDHLFLGDRADKARDMSAKDRFAKGDANGQRLHPERTARGNRNGARLHPEKMARGDAHYSRRCPALVARGERSGAAKVTEADVIAIRARAAEGETQASLAAEFGLNRVTISLIVRRRRWAHVA